MTCHTRHQDLSIDVNLCIQLVGTNQPATSAQCCCWTLPWTAFLSPTCPACSHLLSNTSYSSPKPAWCRWTPWYQLQTPCTANIKEFLTHLCQYLIEAKFSFPSGLLPSLGLSPPCIFLLAKTISEHELLLLIFLAFLEDSLVAAV